MNGARLAVAVAAGAAAGALLRGGGGGLLEAASVARPLGTLAANAIGSGVLGAVLAKHGEDPWKRALLGVGLCGAFTTFSGFALDVLALERWFALVYVLASLVLGVAAAHLGGVLRLPHAAGAVARDDRAVALVAVAGAALAFQATASLASVAGLAAGGVLGSLVRFGVSLTSKRIGVGATLIVNLAGCLLAGLSHRLEGRERLLVVVGVIGGLTTFSTLSCELLILGRQRRFGLAGLYLAASLAGIALAHLGRRL